MQQTSRLRGQCRFFVTVLLFSLLYVLPASAVTMIPLTVEKGGNLIKFTRKYCTSEYHWKEIAKINHLTSPYALYPGSRLYVPLALLKKESLSGEIVSVSGAVYLVRNDKQLKKVEKGDRILPGQSLVTEDDGFAHIAFPDHKFTRVSSGSQFTLTYMIRLVDNSFSAEFYLKKGRLTHDVKSRLRTNDSFRTRTPVSITGVRGTEFRVKMVGEKVNVVETLKGVVAVDTSGEQIELPKGLGIKVEEGKSLEMPRKLPSIPVNPTIENVYKVLPVVFPAPVDDYAEKFRMRITLDESGSETILEKEASPSGSFTLLALTDGIYYGFLTAIDEEGFESPAATPFKFEVRTVPGSPIFSSPLNGRAFFDKQLTLEWLHEEGVVQYHLQLAKDDLFETILIDKIQTDPIIEFTDLEPGNYFFRVQAIASDGFKSLYSLTDSWKVEEEPSLGDFDGSLDGGINFKWANMGEGITYDVQIGKNKKFSNLQVVKHGLAKPEFVYTEKVEPQTYYVRVRGVLGDGQVSPWTPPQSIKIDPPPFTWIDGTILLSLLVIILL